MPLSEPGVRGISPETLVLVVEDNPGDALLVGTALADAPRLDVVGADCLAAAIAWLRDPASPTPTAIFLDLGLPDAGGVDVLRRVLDEAPDVPVIVLTGAYGEEIGAEAMRAGAQDFVEKSSLDGASLRRALRYAVERHARGRLLRTAEESLRNVIEANQDAMLVLSEARVILLANPSACALFGRSKEDLLGSIFEYDVEAGTRVDAEIPGPGGSGRDVEMRVSALVWRGEPALLASIRDITERKRAAATREQMLHVDRLASIGKLTAGVVHEISNPMAYIAANLGVMRDGVEELAAMLTDVRQAMATSARPEETLREVLAQVDLDERIKDARSLLDDCLEGVRRITTIVGGLRGYSRIEQDDVEATDLNEVVRAALAVTMGQIRQRAALELSLEELPAVHGDRGKLVQVLTNLLVNAAQAIAPDAPGAHTIRVQTTQRGHALVVAVEDTGTGMSREVLGRIGEPFFTTKVRDEGTGLGLAISIEIVRDHGGEIHFESHPGRGTRVEVTLPIRRSPA